MKKVTFFLFILFSFTCLAQQKQHTSFIDVSYFKGSIALHNTDIQHLITGHPEGFVIGFNKKTYGYNEWEHLYNYPDYGFSVSYQNLKNEFLGENYGVYAHYNFYFLKRNLVARIGQGLAYTTNPYHKESNFRNIAFGSRIMSSTYVMLQYKKERLIDKFGLQAGITLIHYSNANVKAPNTSINTITANVGVVYNLDDEPLSYQPKITQERFTEPIKFNVAFRAGINESDVVDSGQFPFYIFSAYADKRLNRKSAVHFGADLFLSNFLKEYIEYKSIAFPEENIQGDEDYKRVGAFVGHELFINKLSLLTQLGYYVYYPVDFEGRTYFRVGLKHYFTNKFFGAITLKSHGAKAEAVEFGIGVRL